MRIVVIGAGGFVGGWVAEELSLRKDIEQVACVRKWASAVRLARRGIAIEQADLEDIDGLARLLPGTHAVINAAMPPVREPELVGGLYEACVRAGVRRLVQFSSAAVYGDLTGPVDESLAPAPNNDYARGKAEMERRLKDASAAAPQVVILRPSIVYGPFSDGWTVRYVKRIVSGRWLGLGSAGEGTCNLVHAQDVARAAIAAATTDIPPGCHILNLNGPEVVTWNQYIERLGDALGLSERVVPSVARFRLMAASAEWMRKAAAFGWVRKLYRRSAGTTRAVMTNAKAVTSLYPGASELQLLSRRVHYLSDRAVQTLGIRSTICLDQGLRQSADWCRIHGVV